MNRFILLLFLLLPSFMLHGKRKIDQNTKVMITVGVGNDKNEAITYALKEAIEQSFGTFVSANTTIINDELAKDEIISISSGNIVNYKELLSSQLANGKWSVTLESEVSLTKLLNFAQSKGDVCELSGNTLAQQIKYNKLIQRNSQIVMDNLYEQLKGIITTCFDKKVEVIPHINPTGAKIEVVVRFVPNQNWETFKTIAINTLNSLQSKTVNCEGIGLKNIIIKPKNNYGQKVYPGQGNDLDRTYQGTHYFSVPYCATKFDSLSMYFNDYINTLAVEDNLGNSFPLANEGSLLYLLKFSANVELPNFWYVGKFLEWTDDDSECYFSFDIPKEYKYEFSYFLNIGELENLTTVQIKETVEDTYPCINFIKTIDCLHPDIKSFFLRPKTQYNKTPTWRLRDRLVSEINSEGKKVYKKIRIYDDCIDLDRFIRLSHKEMLEFINMAKYNREKNWRN